METKREFLKKLGLLTVAGLAGSPFRYAGASAVSGKNRASKKQIGLQLYSLGKELTDNVPAGLKKVAQIGYTSVECAGYNRDEGKMYNYSMEEFGKLARDAGLKVTGSHVNPPIRKYTRENAGELADFWKKTIDFHARLGVSSLVQPGMPSIQSHEDAARVCEAFNKAGEIAKAAGIRWGYHNHSGEYRRLEKEQSKDKQGDVIYDLLLEGTDPSLVFFEMDVYWTVMGQHDPLEYFEKYRGRFPILHIKDRSILGKSGMMNFENIFNSAYAIGLDEFYVELENIRENITQFEGVKQCYDYLNNAPFVK
jgi:sugar phosphate isomerase/epimerase